MFNVSFLVFTLAEQLRPPSHITLPWRHAIITRYPYCFTPAHNTKPSPFPELVVEEAEYGFRTSPKNGTRFYQIIASVVVFDFVADGLWRIGEVCCPLSVSTFHLPVLRVLFTQQSRRQWTVSPLNTGWYVYLSLSPATFC